MDAPATRRFTPSLRHTKVLSRVFIVVSRSCASLMNVRYDLRAVVHIWPQYIHIFLSYSYPSWRIPSIHVVSYCGCIVIPLFTSIIEENTLKAPLKRLSDSRSSHIWITNVAGSPRTEVMLVKGCEGTLTMLRLYRCSDVSIQHGSIGVGKYRPINRTSPSMRYRRITPPTLWFLVGHVRCRLLCYKMHRLSLKHRIPLRNWIENAVKVHYKSWYQLHRELRADVSWPMPI